MSDINWADLDSDSSEEFNLPQEEIQTPQKKEEVPQRSFTVVERKKKYSSRGRGKRRNRGGRGGFHRNNEGLFKKPDIPKPDIKNYTKINDSKGITLIIDVQKNVYDAVITCMMWKKNKIEYVNLNRAHNYACYVKTDQLSLVDEFYDKVVFKSIYRDINYLDKIVSIFLNSYKIMKYYFDLADEIVANFDTIKEEIIEERSNKNQSYYDLYISGFKYNIANLHYNRDELHELFELDSPANKSK